MKTKGDPASAGPRDGALSRRELDVLTHLAQGKNARQVGEALGISERTVSAYSQSAFRKLNAVNTTQAVAIAIRDGLIEL